jgi:hypothetical protein
VKAHWHYLKYVLRHKWFVFQEGRTLGVSFWQLLIHDMSKFSRAEWFAYVDRFHKGVKDDDAFNRALLHHYHANPHHWEHWVLHGTPQRMPDKYVSEMIADWKAAGLALGKPDTHGWYLANRERISMHAAVRQIVERVLGVSA